MPLLFVNASAAQRPRLAISDWLSLVGFATGVVLEVAADVQKAVWVRRGRPGGFCRSGVWRVSRHPNYFGEILQWWCAWAFAYSSGSGVDDPGWWACIISPVFTMNILLN